MTKLTLSVDKDVIAMAKQLAQERGTSVSAMFSEMILSTTKHSERDSPRIGPLTSRATGLVSLPEDKTDRELIEEALAERHKL